MARGKSSRIPDIDEVRSRFEQWRQTRQGKARIPDELWSAAVAVARRDGVNRTAAQAAWQLVSLGAGRNALLDGFREART